MIQLSDIIRSIQFVVENSKYVSINQKKLDAFVHNYKPTSSSHWSVIYPIGYERKKSIEDEVDFLFLIGSQAFCFWGYPEKWTIQYKGKTLDGWWALIASFERALERNIPILDGDYLASMSVNDVKALFQGIPEIPLLEERVKILNQIGTKLVSDFGGRFHNAFDKSFDAFSLLQIISSFYGFDDVAEYEGNPVYFYKKAQVVISDIHALLTNTNTEVWKILTSFLDMRIIKFRQFSDLWEFSNMKKDYQIQLITEK